MIDFGDFLRGKYGIPYPMADESEMNVEED